MTDKQKLLDYLKSQELLSLATMGTAPAVCTVYYSVDGDFNFYIVTDPQTEHGKNISANRQVAFSISDTHQPMFGTKYKIGVQGKGTAEEIKGLSQMKSALGIWAKHNQSTVGNFLKHISAKTWRSRPFIIRPTEIKWFNEELYGEEGTEIFKF